MRAPFGMDERATEVKASGEASIAAHASENAHLHPLVLYSSWFCPYAQRAWITLEELGADYVWFEVNPYLVGKDGGETKNPKPLEQKRKEYPEFVKASRRGLVPAIRHRLANGEEVLVCDSMVTSYYLDEAFSGGLMPSSPGDRAKVRLGVDCINNSILPAFYRLLMRQDTEGRQSAKRDILDGLLDFASLASSACDGGGNFFLGSRFSLADIALAPWFPQRITTVAAHYRGFEVPDSNPEFQWLHKWSAAVAERPSIRRTRVSDTRLIANYSGYADNSCSSAVAQQFRDNGAAAAPPRAVYGDP